MNPHASLFFIQGSGLVCLNKKIRDLVTKQAENEKIVYIQYADENPF